MSALRVRGCGLVQALQSLGVSCEQVWERVTSSGESEHCPLEPGYSITGSTKQVIDRAASLAKELAHPTLSTQHILLALLGDQSGPAGSALRDVGLRFDRAAEVVKGLEPELRG